MTKRVIMGQRGGSSGLYVSKPGVDVETAGEDGMLLSTDVPMFQVVQSGSFEPSGILSDLTFVDLGFRPLLIVTRQQGVTAITYNSNNHVTIELLPFQWNEDTWIDHDQPYLANTCYWAVTNMPAF